MRLRGEDNEANEKENPWVVTFLPEGVYTIRLESTDGSVFFINGELVIDNDEPHGLRAIEKVIALKAGYYPIKLLYTSFRQSGYLKISWSGPGFEMKEIAADYLFHMPDLAN